MTELFPNKNQKVFLDKSYNYFYDLYEEYFTKKDLSSEEKFNIVFKIYAIYTELLKYEPIKGYLKYIERTRPEGEKIALVLFEIIRHIITHFPFFSRWNDVCFHRDIILWNGKKHSKIDNFFKKNEGKEEFEWRIWNNINKEMKYGYKINFPTNYTKNIEIYLKDIINEDQGIEFSLILIKKVLDSQIIKISEKK